MTERYPEPFHTADIKANRWRDAGRVLVAGALGAGVAAAGLEIVDWKHGRTDWAASRRRLPSGSPSCSAVRSRHCVPSDAGTRYEQSRSLRGGPLGSTRSRWRPSTAPMLI